MLSYSCALEAFISTGFLWSTKRQTIWGENDKTRRQSDPSFHYNRVSCNVNPNIARYSYSICNIVMIRHSTVWFVKPLRDIIPHLHLYCVDWGSLLTDDWNLRYAYFTTNNSSINESRMHKHALAGSIINCKIVKFQNNSVKYKQHGEGRSYDFDAKLSWLIKTLKYSLDLLTLFKLSSLCK